MDKDTAIYFEKNILKEYESLIEDLNIGICVFHTDGTVLYANDNLHTMFGYSWNELESEHIRRLFNPRDLPFVLGKAEKSGYHEQSPLRLPVVRGKKKNGNRIYLQFISAKEVTPEKRMIKVTEITELYIDWKNIRYALDQAATVSVTDPDGNILYVNDRFCEISKYSRAELIGKNHRIVKSGCHPPGVYKDLWKTITRGKVWRSEICNKAKDGTYWWGDATIVPFLDENGKPYQYVGIRSDITEKKKMEEKIRKKNEQIRLSEQKFRSLVQNAYDVIAILDEQSRITYISPNISKKINEKPSNVEGKSFLELLHVADVPKYNFIKNQILQEKEKSAKFEARLKNKTKTWNYCEVVMTNLTEDPAVRGIAVNIRDVTEQKKDRETIYMMTYFDRLTELPNRMLLENSLKELFQYWKKKKQIFTLMLVDLSDFRFVNDSIGIEMGDSLIREAAKRMMSFIKEKGELFRLDGHDFALLLPEVSGPEAAAIAQEMIRLFEKPFLLYEYELYVSVNIGISTHNGGEENTSKILKNAYTALKYARDKGKNTYAVFTPHMNIESFNIFTLKSDLFKALKNGEFFLEFQPRIDTETYRINGAEALIRWNHPQRGVVSPREFIPLAEESGLIDELDEMVLQLACRQNKCWQEKNLPPVVISVNFSVQQMLNVDTPKMVGRILEETVLAPEWLEIELTETAIIKDEWTIQEKIDRLRAMGVRVAIDDFGTGFGSLSYLKKIKADTLKIDRSFIKGIPEETDSKEIVSSIIRLTQRLNMKVVAEGVENRDQLAFLKEKNCDEIQGYLFSRPVSDVTFEKLLRKGVCDPEKEQDITFLDEDRRKSFRVRLLYPLAGEMTVAEYDGKEILPEPAKAAIHNIGPGGMGFECSVQLPVRQDVLLKFSTVILGEKVSLQGTIVWKREMGDGVFAYGIRFIQNYHQRARLINLLNRLKVKVKKTPLPEGCTWIPFDKKHFLKRV